MPDPHDPIDAERLAKAIRRLRPHERAVLLLSARERLSNDEIASRLGIKPEAAASRLAVALRKLDRALQREARPWWRLW